jgi:hypothetical protein
MLVGEGNLSAYVNGNVPCFNVTKIILLKLILCFPAVQNLPVFPSHSLQVNFFRAAFDVASSEVHKLSYSFQVCDDGLTSFHASSS